MEVFKEPRGVMRILQFVFSLVNIAVLRSFEGFVDIEHTYCQKPEHVRLPFSYPFDLSSVSAIVTCKNQTTVPSLTISLLNNFSSEAEFLFTICWMSILFVVVVAVVYTKFREEYESTGNLALVDFVVSVLLAVLWIACLGAWGYGQSQLKNSTTKEFLTKNLNFCSADVIHCANITRSSVMGITQTLILSFLNFFLWAASLWFVYKETPWYQQFQRT